MDHGLIVNFTSGASALVHEAICCYGMTPQEAVALSKKLHNATASFSCDKIKRKVRRNDYGKILS